MNTGYENKGLQHPMVVNDKIYGISILSRPTCRSVNGMGIFNSAPRRKRSHGHRHYTYPILHDVLINFHLQFMQNSYGMHHIRPKLFSLPLSKLYVLYNSFLENHVTNHSIGI